jgi:Co/Zn/Cd efflux system component
MDHGLQAGFRRAVQVVAALNLAYFAVEFVVALSIGSVSLLADSADFLEDASVNLLILLALSWTPAARARAGMVLAGLLLAPALAFLWALGSKLSSPLPPDPLALSLTGAGALAVNLSCAALLARFRAGGGSLAKAAFLSARNDAAANVGIILAGMVTARLWPSVWPDIITGLAIAAMNIDAAREVWAAARTERAATRAAARGIDPPA